MKTFRRYMFHHEGVTEPRNGDRTMEAGVLYEYGEWGWEEVQ